MEVNSFECSQKWKIKQNVKNWCNLWFKKSLCKFDKFIEIRRWCKNKHIYQKFISWFDMIPFWSLNVQWNASNLPDRFIARQFQMQHVHIHFHTLLPVTVFECFWFVCHLYFGDMLKCVPFRPFFVVLWRGFCK